MPQKLRINLTISREVKHDMEKRRNFNVSRFLETKYREEFLNEDVIKEQIKIYEQDLELLKRKLAAIQGAEAIVPKYDMRRCPVCNMFFHEDISIRQKIHIYKSLYVCKQCSVEQQDAIKQLVREMKERELEVKE